MAPIGSGSERENSPGGNSEDDLAGDALASEGQADGVSDADRIIDAALSLAEVQGWSRLALADVAEEAGLSLLDVYRAMPSKFAILVAFGRRLDRAVLAGGAITSSEGEAPRDRLFDVMMRRFDALQPHREGVRAIMQDLRRDPLTALAASSHLVGSMVWMLETAGLPASGLGGGVRANILAGVYLAAMRTFLDDDTLDLSRTMADLDRRLRRASGMLGLTRARFGRSHREDATSSHGNRSYDSAYAWDTVPDPLAGPTAPEAG